MLKLLFPRAAAWLSALALAVFAGALGSVMSWLYRAAASVWFDAPRIGAFFMLLGVVSPIVLIAFGSHALHAVLDRFAGRKTPRGLAPGLMSWWTGLFGWLVLMLASWTSICLVLVIHPQASLFGLLGLFRIDSNLASVFSIPTVVWFLVAALLFQVERRVRDKIAAGPDSTT